MGICIFERGANMKSFQQTHRMARNGFFEPVFPNPGMGGDVWIWGAQPGAAPCCVGRGSWCLLSAVEEEAWSGNPQKAAGASRSWFRLSCCEAN